MRLLGWSVEDRALDARRGGHQALLLPRRAGGFHVIVDPEPTPSQKAEKVNSALLRKWRLAHEYAHTFFYAAPCGSPRRATPPTPDEEAFCDAFANELVGCKLSSRPT